jgi:DNA-directed RNA polymerase specialized sigma24 family protein
VREVPPAESDLCVAEGVEGCEERGAVRREALACTAYLLTGEVHRAEDLVQEILARAVRSLRFCEDLTGIQGARVLGCSVSAVKSRAGAALERLRVIAPDLLAAVTEEPPS